MASRFFQPEKALDYLDLDSHLQTIQNLSETQNQPPECSRRSAAPARCTCSSARNDPPLRRNFLAIEISMEKPWEPWKNSIRYDGYIEYTLDFGLLYVQTMLVEHHQMTYS